MTEVILHIYDVTNSSSEKTNNTIVQINKIFKDGIGFGGIFHSAVQIFGDEEWSFGYCERGTGVFSCPSGKNPLYTYRESVILGKTDHTIFTTNLILREMSREWPGHSYDLLSKNCNHFCDQFCEKLGVPQLPAWVNRFAHAGDAAAELAESTAIRLRQAKTEIVSASKVAYRFLAGVALNNSADPTSIEGSSSTSEGVTPGWLKNLISPGPTTQSNLDLENRDEEVSSHQQQRKDVVEESSLRQNSRQAR